MRLVEESFKMRLVEENQRRGYLNVSLVEESQERKYFKMRLVEESQKREYLKTPRCRYPAWFCRGKAEEIESSNMQSYSLVRKYKKVFMHSLM